LWGRPIPPRGAFSSRVSAGCSAVQYGKLLIVAKLGELMPAASPKERGGKGGRGKKASPPTGPALAKDTISAYRKVASNAPKIVAKLGQARPVVDRLV